MAFGFAVAVATSLSVLALAKPPNLVFLLTDDMGYNSPGFVNSEVLTPALDNLRSSGVQTHLYTYKFCSPSRAAFLTGRWPWRVSSTICTGDVCNYLPAGYPMGVHTGFSMLPTRLSEANYTSYHVGKWHEGLYAPQFTPLGRGFAFSNGFLCGGEDHFTAAADLGVGNCNNASRAAVRDAFIQNRTAPEVIGEYTGTRFGQAAVSYIHQHAAQRPDSPLFLYVALHNTHAPLEALPEDLALYPAGKFPWAKQQKYYAMMSAVDRSVSNITTALKTAGLWENTLVVWTGDNGAPVQVGGSNGQYRGGKGSNWEGGLHVPAVFSGGVVPAGRRGVVLDAAAGALHLADVHATFLAQAGLQFADPNPAAPAPVDGLDMWPWITGAAPTSPRVAAGIVLDHLLPIAASATTDGAARSSGSSSGDSTPAGAHTRATAAAGAAGATATGAMIKGGLKLIVGGANGEAQATWYGGPPAYFTPNASLPVPPMDVYACSYAASPPGCLFNLTADPYEHDDLAAAQPALFAELLTEFLAFNRTYHPSAVVPPYEGAQLCDAAAEGGNVAAPWRSEPLPQDK